MTRAVMILCIALASIVMGEYELILRLKDTNTGYFSTNVGSTGNENVDNPEANTYSIIGQIGDNLDAYRGDDGKFEFKLIYGNADGTTYTLVWKQTSWIETSPIAGYEAISGIEGEQDVCLSAHGGCCCFKGLGLSDSTASFIDGNGGEGCWCNAVGAMTPFGPIGAGQTWQTGYTGMPAFNYKVAHSEELYINNQRAECERYMTWDTATSQCVRDCDSFAIDEYLGCSTVYDNDQASIDNDIETLQDTVNSDHEDRIKANEDAITTITDTTIPTLRTNLEDAITTNSDDIDTLETTTIPDLQAALEAQMAANVQSASTEMDELRALMQENADNIAAYLPTPNAEAVSINPMNGMGNGGNMSILSANKDLLLLMSLLINVFVLSTSLVLCVKLNKSYKYNRVANYASEA